MCGRTLSASIAPKLLIFDCAAGGTIVAATATGGVIANRSPQTALLPWVPPGAQYTDPRKRALSWAILAPNPHNHQPWLVDLSTDGQATLYVDTTRLLPHTDPFSRQITIGLGCFIELARMSAAQDGIGIIEQLATAVLARRLPDGVHPSQFGLLSNLTRLGDGKTPMELARAFHVPKASMTNSLMQLEKRGFIMMQIHPDDMRKKLIFVTEAGRLVYRDAVIAMDSPIAEATADIDVPIDILLVLEQLRKKLDGNRDI